MRDQWLLRVSDPDQTAERKREAEISLPSCDCGVCGSEAETRLHFDHTRTQRSLRLPEVRVGYLRLDASGPGVGVAIQVELVEQIVEIHTEFNASVFADQLHVR